LQRFRRCEAGTTAIEFAIIAPVLFLLLGAICEAGAFLLIQNSLQAAAESAARQIRLGKVGSSTVGGALNQMNIAQFKAVVCAKLTVSNCSGRIHIDLQKASSFAGLANKMPSKIEDVGPQNGGSYSEVFDPGGPGEQGSLIITYDWSFVFPMLGPLLGNVGGSPNIRRLYGVSVFENES
jgi:Flp pilus assembly pilin Flp